LSQVMEGKKKKRKDKANREIVHGRKKKKTYPRSRLNEKIAEAKTLIHDAVGRKNVRLLGQPSERERRGLGYSTRIGPNATLSTWAKEKALHSALNSEEEKDWGYHVAYGLLSREIRRLQLTSYTANSMGGYLFVRREEGEADGRLLTSIQGKVERVWNDTPPQVHPRLDKGNGIFAAR